MSDRATSINPDVLVWARERAGLSVAEAAQHVQKRPEELSAWEVGSAFPTYHQLERLAEIVYHRPVALFFLPEPPDEAAPQQEFRTLPDFDIAALGADTRLGARLGRAYQESLRELTGGVNPARRQLIRDLQFALSEDVHEAAQGLREYLGVDLAQQKSWRNTADAMANWRGRIEDVGVFVFKRSFKQREISGFCLADDVFPIVMINNSTPFTRQVFTLFHEVAHLLHGLSSITTVDGGFVDRMTGSSKSLETRCNLLAAEFLVPIASFPWAEIDRRSLPDSVAAIASDYNVSREVILRRVLDRGLINSETYRDCVRNWAEEYDGESDRSGGSYYNNQAAYLGQSYLRLAFSRYRAGLISISDLAEHLGIKAKNVSKLEDAVAGRL